MDGFERRRELKKENIIAAALELFQSYGCRKVSISEIANKAGVSPVTIYNHFGSKDGLVREAVKKLYLELLEKFRAVIRADRPFPEKLETLVFDKTQLAGQKQGELLQISLLSDPEFQQFVELIWRLEINQMMVDLFEEGKKQGYIDSKLSVEAIMAYMEILRQGAYNSPSLLEETKRNPDLYGEIISIFIYGLNG